MANVAPTNQKGDIRPIAFVLQDGNEFSTPIVLSIRPTDLTRPEPSRVTVRQTLGRGVQGWVDSFGEGLPTVTIAGHTGWRVSSATGKDGVQSFLQLNNLISHEYHAKIQEVIEAGRDPSEVKLILVDMLDDFVWSVSPMTFTLQRSRSQPLLMKYNIQLQAIDTSVDNPLVFVPNTGDVPSGLKALDDAISKLESLAGGVESLVSKALGFKDALLAPLASIIKTFVTNATRVFNAVNRMVSAIKNGVSSTVNSLIGIASDMAEVGNNIFKTISAIAGLPSFLKGELAKVKGAFNDVACIFKNSLRPRKTYEDYSGVYGASGCSSTTGGGGASIYTNKNPFDLMQPSSSPVSVSAVASSSMTNIRKTDVVLAPLPVPDILRKVKLINSGLSFSEGAEA